MWLTCASSPLVSRVNLGAVAEVEADRLHNPEGCARGEHVGRRQHARVLLDDRLSGGGRGYIQKAPHGGPGVLAVLHEERGGIDRVDRGPDARGDIRHVLLVQGDVVAGSEPAEVAADEALPRGGECGGRRLDVAGNILGAVAEVD